MQTSQVDADRVMDVWSWCSAAYLRHGRKLSLPAGTDPAKTYQWRYATAIAKKFGEWDLSDDAATKFIDIAVGIAKEKGLLNKGLSILHQHNMLELCHQKLQEESTHNTRTLESIRFVKSWLDKKIAGNNAVEVLSDRNDPYGFCNLTMWFQASRISPLYLALSRSCSKVLTRLDSENQDERGLLPKTTELYIIRSDFLKDQGNRRQARTILEQDWREPPCQLPS